MIAPAVQVLEGFGLHGGRRARVELALAPGPVILGDREAKVPLADLRVVSTARRTTVTFGDRTVATVEHLFAACAGTGVHEGLSIEVLGDELPLLDGGAGSWCDALAQLGARPSAPRLRILEEGEVVVGDSRYTFRRGSRRVTVQVDFRDARLVEDASWEGSAEDFRARIAPARTFAFLHELPDLERSQLASHVTPSSAILVTPDAILSAGPAFEADEPARHKLLDLLGDLFLYGGPPDGQVTAVRPGHTATHAAMRIARDRGMVARS